MKVKELIRLLKQFKDAELNINNESVVFEAYETNDGKLVFNIKLLNEK